MATRWGVLSCGAISHDFTTALKHLPPDEHQVLGVAARSLESAEKFAEKFSIPKAYGSYKELCENADIDIVYIGTIHPHHYELCKLALAQHKHVLCEKPLGMNGKQVADILHLAKEAGVFFMEGFWSRCFPVYRRLREALQSGVIGEARVIQASLGFDARGEISRLSEKALGGGALLDVGCYPVQLADLVFGKPEEIQATSTMQPSGVDETTVLSLRYPQNKMAVLTCSVSCNLGNSVVIYGSKGSIEIPKPMWCPTEIIINGTKETFSLPKFSTDLVFSNSEGFTYEAQHVREMLLKGAVESPLVSHDSTRNIVHIMDQARKQIGLIYDADLS